MTQAVMTRCLSTRNLTCNLIRGLAVSTLSRPEAVNRVFQLIWTKFWPKYGTEIELGVGGLPKQKVANAIFTASSNKQIKRR